jgi:hypothetical protein
MLTHRDKAYFFMISHEYMLIFYYKVYAVDVKDTTVERKTADNLFKMMTAVVNKVNLKWGLMVIAFMTNASGESCKACQLLCEVHSDLVTPDCYAHQVITMFLFETNKSDNV